MGQAFSIGDTEVTLIEVSWKSKYTPDGRPQTIMHEFAKNGTAVLHQ